MQSDDFIVEEQYTEHLYAHVTGVLIVIIFIMGPEGGGGGGPDPHDPLAGSALAIAAHQEYRVKVAAHLSSMIDCRSHAVSLVHTRGVLGVSGVMCR